jgi:ubiquitin-conjugating enzyme E2 J2
MASTVYAIRLSRDYLHIQKSPIPYIQTHPRPGNILTWPYVITGPPDTPYANGQYYGTLTFPVQFPYAAPTIQMTTPSGRFVPNAAICTTFTNLHPEEWNPAWTVETILVGFLSFMTGEEIGNGTCIATDEARRNFAAASRRFNSLKVKDFGVDFADVHEENVGSGELTQEEVERIRKLEEATRGPFWKETAIKPVVKNEPTKPPVVSEFAGKSLRYEEHVKEDWNKFGSMEDDDIDYYAGEDYDNDEEDEDMVECKTSATTGDDGKD